MLDKLTGDNGSILIVVAYKVVSCATKQIFI